MPHGQGDVSKANFLADEESGQSVVVVDPSLPDSPMIFVSDEFEHQTGYSAEEALGRNCRFLQGPETSPEAIEAIRAAIRAQTPITIDILNYRKNGETFWNRLRIRPQYNANGQVLYYIGAQNPVPENEKRPDPIDEITE
jgi:PAS domain S-box-containing protein